MKTAIYICFFYIVFSSCNSHITVLDNKTKVQVIDSLIGKSEVLKNCKSVFIEKNPIKKENSFLKLFISDDYFSVDSTIDISSIRSIISNINYSASQKTIDNGFYKAMSNDISLIQKLQTDKSIYIAFSNIYYTKKNNSYLMVLSTICGKRCGEIILNEFKIDKNGKLIKIYFNIVYS